MDSMYHEGHRAMQEQYRGRKVADRLEQRRKHTEFTEEDKAFIESVPFFFLATAHGGAVDCSMKGGMPGFVRVTGASEIAWPDYDGNRMYRSLGNIHQSPKVGLLFLKFDGESTRIRLTGNARIDENPAALDGLPGAKRLVRMEADYIYYNCPRYIPKMEFVEPRRIPQDRAIRRPSPNGRAAIISWTCWRIRRPRPRHLAMTPVTAQRR